MVKREDEQAFAELNASNAIFVEDAVRLLCEPLAGDDRIGDFRVIVAIRIAPQSRRGIDFDSRSNLLTIESRSPPVCLSGPHGLIIRNRFLGRAGTILTSTILSRVICQARLLPTRLSRRVHGSRDLTIRSLARAANPSRFRF